MMVGMRWPTGASLVVVLAVLAIAGCTSSGDDDAAADEGATSSSTSPTPQSPDSTDSPSPTRQPSPTLTAPTETRPTQDPLPPVTHPVSLPALMRKDFEGARLRLGDVLAEYSTYTRHAVTYRSGDLTISGIMNVPDGNGPFPVLVLNHGYIDPSFYVTGQGLAREQDFLARRGYVVLHTDYRNHAGSDPDPSAERRLRLGYTEDVINAVLAIKRSRLPFLDGGRVGLLGRSMGGGVTLNALVVRPGLVDAATIYASVSSRAFDNFDHFIRDDPGDSQLSDAILQRWGEPQDNPRFWRGVSPRTYFDRITEPVLMHHGTADESCPLRWAHATYDALQAADVTSRLLIYPGEPHAFIADWELSIRRTTRFFDRHL
jgi:dipeptidyl aminopeptidase/acylaminoacyl peptidase